MTELIAEIGLAHEGSLGIAHSYIDLAASLKIDTVKFQMHIPERESSNLEKFRINFSYEDQNRFNYWDRTSFNLEEWAQLLKHAEDKKLNFLISPFSVKAIEEINKLGLKRLKLGSAEVVDDLIIDKASDHDLEFIISNGFAGDLIYEVIKLFQRKERKLTVLECTSKYPSTNLDFNNERYKSLQLIKNIGFGVSDHSGETSIIKYALATEANIIEAHIVFDKRMFGPDSSSSLEPSQWVEIVKFRNDIKKIKSSNKYQIDKNIKKTFSRSLSFGRDLKKNEKLFISDLESIKADGYGVASKDYRKFLAKKLIKDVRKGDFLKESDFENND